MEILNSRALKNRAAEKLAQASYDPRKLALIHTAVGLGAGLLVTLINLLLDQQVSNTLTGLSGMGTRSILQTLRMVLQYLLMFLLPFWEIGFLHCALRMARSEQAAPNSLPEGFRRFGPVLRLSLLKSFLFAGIAMICTYAASILFSVTPFARPMLEWVQSVQTEVTTMEHLLVMFYALPADQLMQMAAPVLVIFGLLFVGAAIPMFYRFRMTDFAVMDQSGTGAMMAIVSSGRMMRRNCIQLFKLDLSFWWFYGLLALSMVLGYGDVLLSALGIALPISSDMAWLVCYALQLLVQLVLYWYCGSYVQTTYALAYDALRQQKPAEPKPQTPSMKNTPWESLEQQ